MTSRSVNVFTTIDERWVPYACMMIRSVRDHCIGSLQYWIVHENVPVAMQEEVVSWGHREQIDICFVDFARVVSADTSGTLAALPRTSGYPSSVFWGRYCARFFLPKEVRRVIYADVDMLALADLAPLLEGSLNGKAVGAVRCPAPAAALALGLSEQEYFNNGLLVFDLEHFDELLCFKRMEARLRQGGLRFGPQCAFSFAMEGLVQKLDDVWNVQGELRAYVGSNAKLVHFTGDTKPWHALSVDSLRPMVKSVISETPYPGAWQPDLTVQKRLRVLVRTWRNVFREAFNGNHSAY